MAKKGTPYEGRDNIIVPKVYAAGTLLVGLYTNTFDSLDQTTVLADLTEPTGTGYARISLTNTFSAINGLATYDGANPVFENTGSVDWVGDITGTFITDGTYVLHFKDLVPEVAQTIAAGETLTVDLVTLLGG